MTDTAHPCPMCRNDRGAHPIVCGGCQERGRRDLGDLPRLARLIAAEARRAHQNASEPVSGSAEPPLPLHVDQWSFVGLAPPGTVSASNPPKGWTPGDVLCQVGEIPLPDALFSWCRAVADDLHRIVPRCRRAEPELAVSRFAGFLRTHHEAICRQPYADEYLDEIHGLWKRARTLAQDWPRVVKLPAWCPYCYTLTLRRDNGAAFVYCAVRLGGCGRTWVEADYRRLVLILLTEAKEAG